jgi:hypothetical protein
MNRSPLAGGSTPEGLLGAQVALRPMRAGVFIPEMPGLHWHRVWEHALATQCRFWGGSANVPFPLDESLIESELFWALADCFDPDVWLVHTGKLADLEELDPDQYARVRKELERTHSDQPPAIAAGPINIALQDAFVLQWPSEEWQELLSRRTACFDFFDVAATTWGGQHDSPPYPFTDVLGFEELPELADVWTTSLGELERLLLTVEIGRYTRRSRETLEAKRTVRARDIDTEEELCEVLFTDLGHFPLPLTFSEWGLAWYWWGLASDPIAIVVGSQPLDFSLFYAARRMRSIAYWLPDGLRPNASFVRRLAREAHERARNTNSGILVVSASADERDRERALEQLKRHYPRLTRTEVGSWRDVLPDFPGRLYEVDQQGAPQPLVLQQGRTPEVVSPLPRNVSMADYTGMHWMTEVSVRDWQPARHRSLGQLLAQRWKEDPTVVRTSAEGIAYRCPPSLVPPSRTLAGIVTNPELHPIPLFDQVRSILEAQGWRVGASDKGAYARESVALFGGFAELCNALRDPEVAGWLHAFVGAEPYGMLLKDRRRYVTYQDVEARFDMNPEGSLRTLEDAGALLRGLVLKCAQCRDASFYEVAEIGRAFTCRRCRLSQQVTRDRWLGSAEPPWRYGLAEVLFQLFSHNGQLPLLGAFKAWEDSRRPFDTAYELDLWPPDGLQLRQDSREDKREVDIVISDGYRLWVGEATASDGFATGNAEVLRLRELMQLADAVDAYGVVSVTSQQALRDITRRRLRTALAELRVPPQLREIDSIALWPDLPPLKASVDAAGG